MLAGGNTEIRTSSLPDDGLPADEERWRADESTAGLEPAQIGADGLDPAQQPAQAPTQFDHRVPASHRVTVEPYS